MRAKTEIESVEVFAGTAWQAGMVKSMLGAESIDAFLKDEYVGTIVPWWAAPGGANAVKVIVSSVDATRAREIVADYEKNLKET